MLTPNAIRAKSGASAGPKPRTIATGARCSEWLKRAIFDLRLRFKHGNAGAIADMGHRPVVTVPIELADIPVTK